LRPDRPSRRDALATHGAGSRVPARIRQRPGSAETDTAVAAGSIEEYNPMQVPQALAPLKDSDMPQDDSAGGREPGSPFDVHEEPLEEAARRAGELFVEIYRGLEQRHVAPAVERPKLLEQFTGTLH